MIIGIFIALTLIWPLLITLCVGKKNIIPTILITFIFFFISFNSIHIFIINSTTVKVLTTFCIVSVASLMILFGIKKGSFTKQKMMEALSHSWSLYLMIALTVIIRIFTNHINSDSIAYARDAQLIKTGDWNLSGSAFWYKTPVFGQMSSLSNYTIDFFTIYGEMLHTILFAVGINIILRQIKGKKIWQLIVMIILTSISSVFALSYKTSGVNWSAVSITLIFIFASRKRNSILLLMIPFSFSVFSFSPMLTFPVAVIIFAWRKKWDLKEVLYLIIISIFSIVFTFLNILNVRYIYFLVIDVLFAFGFIFIVLIYIKVPEKELYNPLYKFKLLKNREIIKTKKHKIISILIAASILFISELVMLLMIFNIMPFPLIVGAREKAMMTTIPIALAIVIADALLNWKVSDQFKWMLSCVAIMIIYSIVQTLPFVPSYILDRLSLPFSMGIGLIVLIRCYENDLFNSGKIIVRIGAVTTMMALNLTTLFMGVLPSALYSPPSTNIEQNYKFTTSSEREVMNDIITKNPNAVIYSDIAVSSIPQVGDKHSFFTNQDRGLFFGEMKYRVKGIDNSYWEDILEYRQKIQWNPKLWDGENLTILGKEEVNKHDWIKKALEFSFLADSIDLLNFDKDYAKIWIDKNIKDSKNIKRITVFAFRNKEYQKMLMPILNTNHVQFNSKEENGMYILNIK
ncbi:hypothetical protein [Mycoplasma marinum]|uniref:Uncharacterized protein n=1 Tax=Mycoplasma marinum TaxID=1937190 RepID=A0A4V6N9K5_9MOLU|nr:hypothetical protein [Mycoplasma marinum]TCG11488.1 hypothetical protein C4B24_01890 [Mycoplasma marinum]